MGNSIPPLGWVLIILVISMIVVLNLQLFLKRKRKGSNPKWLDAMRTTQKTVKDPFWYENEKMQELSEQVEKLKKNPPRDSSDKQ